MSRKKISNDVNGEKHRHESHVISDLKLRLERQRKDDKVLDRGFDAWDWVRGHGRWLSWAIVIAILVWVGSLVVRQWQEGALKDSEGFLRQAILEYDKKEIPLAEKATAVQTRIDELTRSYPSSRAARYGHALMGDVFMRKSEFSKARDEYTKAMDGAGPDEITRFRMSIAKTYESEDNDAKAIEEYQNILKNWPDTVWKDSARYFLAQALERQDKKDEALKEYEQIKKESAWYTFSKQRVDWLQASVSEIKPASGSPASAG